MKTKHILTALALPALFAACTNDDFESMDFSQVQSERPMLSEDFTLKLSDSPLTRYGVEGSSSLSFNYENGDEIGAAIIDKYLPNEKPADWEIIPSLAGNYPFTYNASTAEWKASTRLGIGHYLFVYPYNAEDNTRGAVNYSLPTVQELYQSEDGALDLNAAVEKDNMAICAALLTEDDAVLEAKMRNIYAYPKFVINFDNGLPITTVSKVVLKYTGNAGKGFLVKGGFDHNEVWNKIFKQSEADPDGADAYFNKQYSTSAYLRSSADGYTTMEYNPYLVAKYPKNCAVKVDNTTNNKVVEVRFMIPGEAMTHDGTSYTSGVYVTNPLSMYIYTNAGVYKINDVLSAIDYKSTTSVDVKKTIVARNTSYTINLDKQFVHKATDELYVVTNIADWNELVAAYGAAEGDIPVAVVGDEFTFDATAKMPTKATFKVSTPVKVKGNVTLSNVTVDKKVTVEEGATLTTSGTFVATDEVENNGTLNIAVYTKKNVVAKYSGIKAITNNATLNIVEKAEADFTLVNNKGAVVENKGIITVDGSNEGTINNAGTLNTEKFKNIAPTRANGTITNMPTINNEGYILAVLDELTNEGTIVNKGEIACKAGTTATIVNKYLIDSQKDKITYITTNEGKVIVYKAVPGSDIKIDNNINGVVEYTTSNTSENFDSSIVTDVIASKDLSISKLGSVQNVTMNGSGKLTLPSTSTSLTNLTVNAGTTTLGSNITVAMLTVKKGANVTIPATLTLTATDMDNDGSILVSGTFATKVYEGDEKAGIVKTEGATGSVKWGYDEAAENAYNAAVKNMVIEYIDETTAYVTNSYKVEKTGFASYWKSSSNKFTARDAFKTAYPDKTTVDAIWSDVEEAVSSIDKDATNKTALITALKASTLAEDDVLYDTKDAASKTKSSAYATFRNEVVNKTITVDGAPKNSVLRTANSLTTAEIDAILAVAKPTMYIWEGCDLDKIVEVWATYDGALALTGISNNEYSDAKGAASGTSKAPKLVAWLRVIYNTSSSESPTVNEIQKALEDLSLTAAKIGGFGAYTDNQMIAVDSNLGE